MTPTPTPGPHSANYNAMANWDVDSTGAAITAGNVTTVGTNGGPSFYGTYDQGGNVHEWNDSTGTASSYRGIRGGEWGSTAIYPHIGVIEISANYRGASISATQESHSIGFRIACSSNPLGLPNFVSVGNANNAADTTSYGAVNYNYQIGTYLVTNSEYVDFLNSIALDTNISSINYTLYHTNMSLVRGGITRTTTAFGGFYYTVKPNYGNKPVVWVSWFDCARYCNWLHNGKGPVSTETGAYDVSYTSPRAKTSGARYWIPTENEWYKAAYYSPNRNGAGVGGYWKYATQRTITDPTAITSDAVGNGPMPPITPIPEPDNISGNNSANYEGSRTDWDVAVNGNNVTTINNNGRSSFYGTYDQTGNVHEWNDNNTSMPGIRGGAWDSSATYVSSSFRNIALSTAKYNNVGFRVASSLAATDDFVAIGNSNNAAESLMGFGNVSYDYRIGKALVTNTDYADFLNNVATGTSMSSTYSSLYNTNMSGPRGGITRNLLNGSYFYTPKDHYGNKPVIWVSWIDCARYCNWLHNGKGPVSTETGAYNLVNSGGTKAGKETNAKYWIPTEDEWVKAAYYSPNRNGSGMGGYWKYATQSDTIPTTINVNGTGDGYINNFTPTPTPTYTPTQTPTQTYTSTPTPTQTYTSTPTPTLTPIGGVNAANYNNTAVWGGGANVTTVGTNGRPSFYGTYDQSGNVFQWNDLDGTTSSSRGRRGGDRFSYYGYVSSSLRNSVPPSNASGDTGFRLASSSLSALSYSSFVTVGDINNLNDTRSGQAYGAVNYVYQIGKYTVTNTEYVEYLRAVATSSDTYVLRIGPGAISVSGFGYYTYTISSNMENKPVVGLSWFNCARYCNWLSNGKPSGAQNSTTTENGAYNLNGAISGNAVAVNATNPNTGLAPAYRLPTENEWYKAAYYAPDRSPKSYWLYATQSDTAPTAISADITGNGPYSPL